MSIDLKLSPFLFVLISTYVLQFTYSHSPAYHRFWIFSGAAPSRWHPPVSLSHVVFCKTLPSPPVMSQMRRGLTFNMWDNTVPPAASISMHGLNWVVCVELEAGPKLTLRQLHPIHALVGYWVTCRTHNMQSPISPNFEFSPLPKWWRTLAEGCRN